MFDLKTLHADVEAERVRRGWSKSRLAAAVRVSTSTISRTAAAGVMEADGVLAMVRWLGVPPEGYVRPSLAGPPTRLSTDPDRMVRADTAAMFRALDRQRIDRSMSWADVAADVGSPQLATQFLSLHRGGRSTIDTLVAAAGWLGCPIAALTRETPLGGATP